MNLLKRKLKFIFAISIIFTSFLIIFSNTQQAEAANEFIKINSARVNAGYFTITWEWLGNDALGGGLGVVGIYPSLNNNIEGIIGTPSGIVALHKNLDGNPDALETTWGRPRNDANPDCHRDITSPEEYTANTQYVTRFNKIFDPTINEYRAINSLSNADKLRITITAGFPCATTGQFRRADSEDYPIDFGAPPTLSLISAPFWQQTLGNGLNFSVKDLTIRVSNPNVDAYYSGTIYGFATDDYASGYGITPIEQYNFSNLGPSTPRGFDGNVTLSMQGNSLSSFPLNPNRYYELFLNAGDASRPFFIYGSSNDSYPNGKAYYSYSSYPCGPYFNPETTCEYGVNNGIADIFFQFGKAETLLGKESAITTDITLQTYSRIDGDLIAWLDNYRDINVYEISTGHKTVVNDTSLKYSFLMEDRKILWTTQTKDNPNDYDRATFLYDFDTGITTDITEKIGMRNIISDFDGQRIVLQSLYGSIPGIYLYDLATSELALIDQNSSVTNPKISGNKILYQLYQGGNDLCGSGPWGPKSGFRLYDIATGEKTDILTCYGFVGDYVIDGDNIIVNFNTTPGATNNLQYIERYKISTGEMTNFSPVSRQITGIDISENIVVWSDIYDIYMYDLVTGKTGRAGMAPKESLYPKVSGNTVVWDDYRNFNADIYMYQLASSNNPPTLSFPITEFYAGDGIEPNKGTIETEFTFKTVYTDADNDTPQNISLIVVGDGMTTTTHALVLDTSAPLELRDGNYANGEQFITTSTFPKKAQYSYHFEASDGKSGTARLPATGDLQFSVINVPVVIVPGIMGSELYKDYDFRTKIWPPSFYDISIVSELSLTKDGTENPLFPMRVGDIIREWGGEDYYKSLITEFENNGYNEGIDIFVFPYDWRLNNTTNVIKLDQRINEILNQTDVDKVNIVAHSMGGLISKLYMRMRPNTVQTFIDIATPHLGSPEAFRTLMWGDEGDEGWLYGILKKIGTKLLSQNMPSIYQLLPSSAYIQSFDSYFYTDRWLNYPQTIESLIDSGGNPMAQTWNNIHDSIDEWQGLNYGVGQTFNIVGCDNATPAHFYKLIGGVGFYEYAVDYRSGDTRVPLTSADALNSFPQQTYYAKNAEHSKLPSRNDVRRLIVQLLNGKKEPFSDFPELSPNRSSCDPLYGWTISFHSPVELHIYDSKGRHVGPTAEGTVENDIPGVAYDIIEDNKFAFLPNNNTYKIVGEATGIGTFNARLKTIENEEVTETRYYNEIPLETLKTNTTFTIALNQTDYTIQIDQDGDGIFESQAQPSSVLNAEESQDLTKPKTTVSLSGTKGQNNWYISDVKVGFSATDDNSGILKTEYSLDNGKNWNIYQQPFTVDAEGSTTILYFSTDRAGNYELMKSQEIKIDKTPPEAKIFFDQNLKQLKIKGIDNLSSVAVVQNENNYTLTDEAGHTLAVDFDKLKTEGKEIKAEIQALRYDGILAPAIPENKLQYEWSLEKDGGIKELNQRIEAEKIFDIRARYNAKKNETVIDIKTGDEEDEKKIKQTFIGFTLLILTTYSGNLDISYDH